MARQLGHKITIECFLPIDRNDPKQQAVQAAYVADLPARLHEIGLASVKIDIKTRKTPDPELPLASDQPGDPAGPVVQEAD